MAQRATPLYELEYILWALRTHCGWASPQAMEDPYKFAMLHGNEDAPSKIEFWCSSTPGYRDPPNYVWVDATTTD